MDELTLSSRSRIFPGDSEMAALMRAKDWSATDLGDPEQWPQALKVAVGILLTSRFEMWLGWGPEVNFLYNDAYRPTLGLKHPDSLGMPTRELWAEIWDDVEPRVRSVYDQSKATWDRALRLILQRNGYPEETYHTFSYSPVLGEDGKAAGLLCAVSEETLRVITERRMETLRVLSARLAGTTDRNSVLAAARAALSENQHDLPFTLTYLADDAAPGPAFSTGLPDGFDPQVIRRMLHLDSEAPQPLLAPLPHDAWDRPPTQAVVVPLTGQGTGSDLGAMLVGLNPLRPFDQDYGDFLKLVAGQIAAGLSGAATYESERRRAQSLADALRMRQDAAAALEQANAILSSEIDKRTAERDRLRALFQHAPSFMCVLSGPDHVFEFANEAYLQLVGHRDLVGKSIREVLPDIEGQGYFELLGTVYRTAEPFIGRELPVTVQRGPGAPGEERFVNLVYQPILDDAGRVRGIFAEGHDVTHRKRAEEALRALNDTLAAQVEARTHERDMTWRISEDLFLICTPDGVLQSVNPAWLTALGHAPQDLVGTRLDALVHPDDVVVTVEGGRALARGQVLRDLDLRLRSRDGEFRWYSLTCVPEGGRIYGAGRDVTARKSLEEQLRRSQKMEALGQLTGGVAHDFNNLLQVISGNLHLLSKDVAGNERAETRVQNALAGVMRGSKLASQLLSFGRRQPLEPKVVNLGRFLQGMDDMLCRTLGEEIELKTVVAAGLWNTLVDPNQIENAVLNLAINARDAMAGQGHLTIEATNASLDDVYASNNDATPGEHVLIAVTDTGTGMDAEILDKVFEPFFSTKPEGKGTGLGLSMVYGLVKQSNGHIMIYSEVGHGTTVKIYLPRNIASEDVLTDLRSQPVQGGTETVLVVEDDDEVRDTTVALLTDLGYRTLRARDAASALQVVESGAPIDLVFTDVVMPGSLRSTELARMARERLPGVAVLFTSGYTANSIVHSGRLDPGVELLPKPYSRETLARKIRHVLANQQHANGVAGRQATLAIEHRDGSRAASAAEALNILLVEDDDLIRLGTADMLESLGHSVVAVGTGAQALARLSPDLDILMTDLGLPDMNGRDLVAACRRQLPDLRVVLVTGDPGAAGEVENAIAVIKPYVEADLERALAALSDKGR
ncbi:hybrid sensor histidine kinase/response regulator [Paracoccus benzoatiresistens]|uniref:histidine kinase n=1 Tax=Paracoccus benzoatiresistens TaxID=2997341 RepID=A0ABT4J6S8_9RHOB|nr:PAS domain-containing protein [Paracoccus sp. EF6]MCZ0962322.1 PAS domain-containing protein [Paracoccus sp. EF6]